MSLHANFKISCRWGFYSELEIEAHKYCDDSAAILIAPQITPFIKHISIAARLLHGS